MQLKDRVAIISEENFSRLSSLYGELDIEDLPVIELTDILSPKNKKEKSPGNSDRKMSELVTMSESRIVTAHGIFNSTK